LALCLFLFCRDFEHIKEEIMTTDERIDAFLKGEPLPVEVNTIEKELATLWQAASESKDEAIRAVTRACQLNLLIYSPNEGAYERAAIALPEIMRRHPSRVIALIAEPEAENEELAAYISSPPISSGSRGEQITIAAPGNAVKNLAGITLPLRIADTPMALWWLDDLPEEDPLFDQLLAASQRLIFDSAFSLDIGNELSRARALSLTWKDGLCGDLNWLRLVRCHELMAQFLDSSDAAPMLSHIEKISFDVVAATEGDAHFSQPFLLLGWLAGRLSLKLNEPLTPLGENAFQTSWQSGRREVIGAITLHKPAVEFDEVSTPIGIMAAQMQFRQNGNAMSFELRRDSSQQQATIRVTKGEQTISESSVGFSNLALAELMAQALELTDRDHAYENALRFATQLI
jgi:glucose-6-phosphate dehydrogenase assembly protein OpcA